MGRFIAVQRDRLFVVYACTHMLAPYACKVERSLIKREIIIIIIIYNVVDLQAASLVSKT